MSTIKIDPEVLGLRPDVSAEEVAEALRQRFSSNGTGKMPQAEALVSLALKVGGELFHDNMGEAFWRGSINGVVQTLRLRDKALKTWLSYHFYKQLGKVPNSDALNSALNTLAGKSLYEGKDYELSNRVCWSGESLYIDMADARWRAIRVTPRGWTIEATTPIPLFRRYAHQEALPDPVPGGDPKQLLDFVNLSGGDGIATLYLVNIISFFIPDIAHPIPFFYGPSGTAKTTTSAFTRRVIDPSKLRTLSLPRESQELVQQLSHHWALVYDNLGDLPDWTQDALCRAVTGEGSSRRELYTDQDDVLFVYRRCLILNGINIAATNADLLRRCILYPLAPISEELMEPEQELQHRFEDARPSILGGLLDTMSKAMALYENIRPQALTGLPGFARWGAAIAQALGTTPEAFQQAYQENIRGQHQEVIQGSLVASLLLAFMKGKTEWEGTPAQLYSQLKEKAEGLKVNTSGRDFPKAANWLSRALNKVKLNLKAQGLEVTQEESGDRRYRLQQSKENTANTAIPPEPHISQIGGKSGGILEDIADTTENTAVSEPDRVRQYNGKSGISPHLLEETPPPQPTDPYHAPDGVAPQGDIPLTCLQHGLTPHRLVPGQGRVCNRCQPPQPRDPCQACSSAAWWWRPANKKWGDPGEWVCGRCHPNPAALEVATQ